MRRWLAQKLFPEAFADAAKYDYLRRRLDDLQHWCGHDQPEIDHAVVWAKKSLRVHFMSLDEYHEHVQAKNFSVIDVGDISRFREELRRRASPAAPAKPLSDRMAVGE